MKRYVVVLGDPAGEFDRFETDSLEALREKAREWAERYPRKAQAFANLERADYDTDGMTSEELDFLKEAQ